MAGWVGGGVGGWFGEWVAGWVVGMMRCDREQGMRTRQNKRAPERAPSAVHKDIVQSFCFSLQANLTLVGPSISESAPLLQSYYSCCYWQQKARAPERAPSVASSRSCSLIVAMAQASALRSARPLL